MLLWTVGYVAPVGYVSFSSIVDGTFIGKNDRLLLQNFLGYTVS